jgi:hypothetical protein
MGDMNAVPPDGRGVYATGSATVREDCTMETWIRDADLTEVFQEGKPRPTWKPSEGPQLAALDRVFASHPDLLPITMSVKWNKSPIVFGHAMLLLRLSRSDAGISYAGASRLDDTAITAPRGCVNMSKWFKQKDEWQQLFSTQLQALDLEHQRASPDPYEALKQAELWTILWAGTTKCLNYA